MGVCVCVCVLLLNMLVLQQSEQCEDWEQKYQVRDVELGALRQQIAEYEHIHKTQSE